MADHDDPRMPDPGPDDAELDDPMVRSFLQSLAGPPVDVEADLATLHARTDGRRRPWLVPVLAGVAAAAAAVAAFAVTRPEESLSIDPAATPPEVVTTPGTGPGTTDTTTTVTTTTSPTSTSTATTLPASTVVSTPAAPGATTSPGAVANPGTGTPGGTSASGTTAPSGTSPSGTSPSGTTAPGATSPATSPAPGTTAPSGPGTSSPDSPPPVGTFTCPSSFGSITVSSNGSTISLVSTNPQSGYTPEIRKQTPTEIEVRFVGASDSTARARARSPICS